MPGKQRKIPATRRLALEWEKRIEALLQQSLYDTGITPEYGQQLLTLSTCSYHTSDGRFVVVARRMD